MVLFIFLGGLALMMIMGLPIAFALLGTSVLMMLWMDVFDPKILADAMFNGADSYPLMAIPFFLLAGELMTAGGDVAPHRLGDHLGPRARAGRPWLCRHHRRDPDG